MAWKDLAEKRQTQVEKLQNENAILEYKLAESEEKSAAASLSGHAHPHTGHVQQVANLQRELEAVRAENVELAKETASLNETLQNTMSKMGNIEPTATLQIQTLDAKNRLLASEIETLKEEKKTLEYKIRGHEDTMRKVQAQRSSDLNLSGREKSLQEQNKKLKDDIVKANAKAERLQKFNDSLQRQLQAEKKNNGDLGWRSDPGKGYNQDDEEPLPMENPRLKAEAQQRYAAAVAESTKQFKKLSIPDELSASEPQVKKKPTPKKRKRSAQEEAADEAADLAPFDPPTEPKRRRAMNYGSFDDPMNLDTSDEELHHPATLLRKPHSGARGKITLTKRPSAGPVGESSDDEPLAFRASRRTKTAQRTSTPSSDEKPLATRITRKTKAAQETSASAASLPTPISPTSPSFPPPHNATFTFKAITSYNADGTISMYDSTKDLGKMAELWDRIEMTTNIWERYGGGGVWQEDYEARIGKTGEVCCVTSKMQKKATKWTKGIEDNEKYACRDCAEAGRPCFSLLFLEDEDGVVRAEYRMLPLHNAVRKRGVSKGFEIRHWVDDSVELVDFDD